MAMKEDLNEQNKELKKVIIEKLDIIIKLKKELKEQQKRYERALNNEWDIKDKIKEYYEKKIAELEK